MAEGGRVFGRADPCTGRGRCSGGELTINGDRRRLYIKLVPEDMNSIFPYDMTEPWEEPDWTVSLVGGPKVQFYDAEENGALLTGDALTWGWEQDPQGPFFRLTPVPSEVWVQAVSAGGCDITLTLAVQQRWWRDSPIWTVTDTVHTENIATPAFTSMQLKQVAFSGTTYRALWEDDGYPVYVAPHWLDADLNGVPEKEWPAAYTAVPQGGEPARMRAAVTIVPTPAANLTPCRIVGTGPGGWEFKDDGALSNGELSFYSGSVACSRAFDPYKVDLIDKLKLSWGVSVNGGPWIDAGQSRNRIYVTWREPTVFPKLESLFWISCRAAKGLGGKDAATWAPRILEAIWGEFEQGCWLPIERVHGKALTYYNPEVGAAGSASDLLASESGSGGCTAWAQLLFGCMQAQGFSSRPAEDPPTGALDILQVWHVTPMPLYAPTAGGFGVKNWSFDEDASYPETDYPYVVEALPYLPGDAHEMGGIEGQGNGDPRCRFDEHFVCCIGTGIYDPSYGIGPYLTEHEHENDLVDTIATVLAPGERCRKKSTGERELLYVRQSNKEGLD